jgi:uncharacterized membrane protein
MSIDTSPSAVQDQPKPKWIVVFDVERGIAFLAMASYHFA